MREGARLLRPILILLILVASCAYNFGYLPSAQQSIDSPQFSANIIDNFDKTLFPKSVKSPFSVDIGPIYEDNRLVAYVLYPTRQVYVSSAYRIELPDELEKTSVRVGYLSGMGIGHINYWNGIDGTGWEAELVRFEEFMEYFNITAEKDGRINLAGEPVYHEYYERNLLEVHFARKHWQNVLIKIIKMMFDSGMAGVMFDGGIGAYWSSHGFFTFDNETMEGFNEYLASKYSEEELRTIFGIENIETFNFKEYLNSLGYYDDSEISPDGSEITDPQARALWRELALYHLICLVDFYKKIRENVDAWENESGRDFMVLINVPTLHYKTWWGLPINILAVLQYVDGLSYEVDWRSEGNAYPNITLAPDFRIVTSLNKIIRSWTLPTSGLSPEWALKCLPLDFIAVAELIAVSAKESKPVLPAVVDIDDLKRLEDFSFLIQKNPQLYNQENYGQIALIYPMASAWYSEEPPTAAISVDHYINYEGAYYLLSDAHYPIDVVVFGDNIWFNRTPSLSDLLKYKAIVLANATHLTDDQVELIIDYVENGGILIAIGELGVYNETGAKVSRPELSSLLEGTYNIVYGINASIHSYGNGTVIHIPDNLAWDYLLHRFYYDPEAEELLNNFTSLLKSVLPSEIETSLSDRTHIIRYRGKEIDNLVFYIVNYEFDFEKRELIKQNNVEFSFKLPDFLAEKKIQVKVYSEENTDGELIDFERDGDWIRITLPEVSVLTVIEVRPYKPKSEPIVISEPTTLEHETLILSGDLLISSDLILRDSSIIVNASSWEPVAIKVLPGGSLTMINSAIEKTAGNYFIVVYKGAKLYMKNSEVSGAGVWGTLDRGGFVVYADDVVITGCSFHDNFDIGLMLYNVTYAVISNNTFYNNKVGLSLAIAGMIDAKGNKYLNNNIGLYATDVFRLRISDSLFLHNSFLGMVLKRGNFIVLDTVVKGSRYSGIYASLGTIKIARSIIESNEIGIFIDGSPLAILLGNQVHNNTKIGIWFNKIVSTSNFPWHWYNLKIPSLLCEGCIINNNISGNGIGILVENKEYYFNEFIRVANNTISENQVGISISNSVAKIYANNFINNEKHVGQVSGSAEFYYDWILAGESIALKTIGNYWDDYSGVGNYTVAPGYEDIYPLNAPAVTSFIGDVNAPHIRILNATITPSSDGKVKLEIVFETWDDTLLSGAPTPDLYCYFSFIALWSPYMEIEHSWIGISGEILPPELEGRDPKDVLKHVEWSVEVKINESWIKNMSMAIYVSDMYCNWARNDTMVPHVAIVRREPAIVYDTDEVTIEAMVFDWSEIANVTLRYSDGNISKDVIMDYDERTGLYVAKIPAFQEGTHVEYMVIAEDIYGNLAESNVYSYDVVVLPSVEITYPTTGMIINNDTITVEWEITAGTYPVVKVELRLDNSSWIDVTGKTNYTFTGLSNGNHTITIRVIDELGNVAEDSVEFTIRVTKPTPLVLLGYIIGGIVGIIVVGTIVVTVIRRRRRISEE